MKTLEPIERIAMPSDEALWQRYVLRQQPVIVTDMPVGRSGSDLRSRADLLQRFGDVPVRVREEFGDLVLRSARSALRGEIDILSTMAAFAGAPWTLRDYLAFIAREPTTALRVNEASPVAALRDAFPPPSVCSHRRSSTPPRCEFFLAPAGATASLHFDHDYRHVLMYQVFGRKRYVLFPPAASPLLHPLRNVSAVLLGNFDTDDQRRFIEFAGGQECVLEPGETLLMPACVWHHIEYLDDACSYSFRFGRDAVGDFFRNNVHLDHVTQNVVSRYFLGGAEGPERDAALARIERACAAVYPDPMAKFRAMRDVLRDIHAQGASGARMRPHFFSGLDAVDETDHTSLQPYLANYDTGAVTPMRADDLVIDA